MELKAAHYTGRFAPSPTGPLHIGSLLSAVASYLDARAHGGRWLLRMEDIDPPREIPGAVRAIIDALYRHALHWDGDIRWQSERAEAYEAAIADLVRRGLAFHCQCSRRVLRANGMVHSECLVPLTNPDDSSLRLRVPRETVAFEDALQGRIEQDLAAEVGDFVLRRRDGFYAYQLAVVVDDADQGITHVVRGSDLLDSTPRQIILQRRLGLPTPHYLHIPVITDASGEKLSKQTFARPIDSSSAVDNLRLALRYLGQPLPPRGVAGTPETLLRYATEHWSRRRIPVRRGIAAIPSETL